MAGISRVPRTAAEVDGAGVRAGAGKAMGGSVRLAGRLAGEGVADLSAMAVRTKS